MEKLKKAKPICIHLTVEAVNLLEKEMARLGISKTSAIEIAIRKAYGNQEVAEKKDSDETLI